MGIGAAVFLIVVGAILTFALDWRFAEIDLDIVGWIFMIAGVIWAAFTLYGWSRRRAAARTPTVVEERHIVHNNPTSVETRRPLDERDRPAPR